MLLKHFIEPANFNLPALTIILASVTTPTELRAQEAATGQPVFLSAEQFVAARFPRSIESITPLVRLQLIETLPNAESDKGKIDWSTVPFKIQTFGRPALTFSNLIWESKGVSKPANSNVAAEAYFNCTSTPSEREFSETDVTFGEVDDLRRTTKQTTNRVKAIVSLNYSAPAGSALGGLGGSASKDWEQIVVTSDEYSRRTRETVQSTNVVGETVTVPPMALRFHEYSLQSTTEDFLVSGNATVDVPLVVTYTRASYGRWRHKMTDLGGFSLKIPIERPVPEKNFQFDVGNWSQYLPSQHRTLRPAATVTITRETTFIGPTEVQFTSVKQCLAARETLQQQKSSVASLADTVAELAQSAPQLSMKP